MSVTEDFLHMSTVQQRVMRVFVSSTFHDMMAEREVLVKKVFPVMRKLCAERDVVFAEIDLRWGITEEEIADGEVLPICLNEIKKCRPFFIGILGSRYGFIPKISPRQIAREPWLIAYPDRSVTELEIREAVLRAPHRDIGSYFYFKKDASCNRENSSKHSNRQKLDALKQEIRVSKLPVREDYDLADDLGENILRDLRNALDHYWPIANKVSLMDVESAAQTAFVSISWATSFRRPEIDSAAEVALLTGGKPLIVTGANGSGKTTVLMSLVDRLRSTRPNCLVIEHSAGASLYGMSWKHWLDRVGIEIGRHCGISWECPADQALLPRRINSLLTEAAQICSVILLLDGMELMDDPEGLVELAWLPTDFPQNVYFAASCAGGSTLEILRCRQWLEYEIPPLGGNEISLMAETFLARFGKRLSESQMALLANQKNTRNPRFLKVLLEELRQHGDWSSLSNRLDNLLAAKDTVKLYELIIERCEIDFDIRRKNFTRDALSLLANARDGLSDAEVLDLLGDQYGPLPTRFWIELQLAFGDALLSRSGLVTIASLELREAIHNHSTLRGGDTPTEQLCAFFASQAFSARAARELPYHLWTSKLMDELANWLGNPAAITVLEECDKGALLFWWSKLEAESNQRLSLKGAAAIESSKDKTSTTIAVTSALVSLGHQAESGALLSRLMLSFDVKVRGARAALKRIGEMQMQCRLYEEAETTFKRLEQASLKDNDDLLAWALLGIVDASRRASLDDLGVDRMRQQTLASEWKHNIARVEELNKSLRDKHIAAKLIYFRLPGFELFEMLNQAELGFGQKNVLGTVFGLDASRLQILEKDHQCLLEEFESLLNEVADSSLLEGLLSTKLAISTSTFDRSEQVAILVERTNLARLRGDRDAVGLLLGELAEAASDTEDTGLAILIRQEARWRADGNVRELARNLLSQLRYHVEQREDFSSAKEFLPEVRSMATKLTDWKARATLRLLHLKILLRWKKSHDRVFIGFIGFAFALGSCAFGVKALQWCSLFWARWPIVGLPTLVIAAIALSGGCMLLGLFLVELWKWFITIFRRREVACNQSNPARLSEELATSVVGFVDDAPNQGDAVLGGVLQFVGRMSSWMRTQGRIRECNEEYSSLLKLNSVKCRALWLSLAMPVGVLLMEFIWYAGDQSPLLRVLLLLPLIMLQALLFDAIAWFGISVFAKTELGRSFQKRILQRGKIHPVYLWFALKVTRTLRLMRDQ